MMSSSSSVFNGRRLCWRIGEQLLRSFHLSRKQAYSTSLLRNQATPRKGEVPKEAKQKISQIRVDRTNLLKAEDITPPNEYVEPINRPGKETLTPLAIDLYSLINAKGPITLHDFMSQTVNHTVHGYYQEKKTEKIGQEGDFITSPEISQLFGEMLGLWIYSTWEALGSPNTFDLIELGPGKGTLMIDILRVLKKFPKCMEAMEIQFVELSLRLREVQYQELQRAFHSSIADSTVNSPSRGEIIKDQHRYEVKIGETNVGCNWNSFLNQIPAKNPSIIIAQEFLDAFPIHQFIYTSKGWREKFVDIDREIYAEDDAKKEYPYHFRIVIAPQVTPAVSSFIISENEKVKEFEQSLNLSNSLKEKPKEGDGLEICPLALVHCEDIANRIMAHGGASLIIDYGEDFAQEDSLRGFKKHKQVHILSEPGTVDVTADVNFAMCRKAAASKKAHVLPLLPQGQFLMNMGIVERVKQLIGQPSVTEIQANYLVDSMKKLVLPEEMGQRFKVLGIIHPTLKGKVFGF